MPSNVGPGTMPSYPALAAHGVYNLGNGIRVFVGQREETDLLRLNLDVPPTQPANQKGGDAEGAFLDESNRGPKHWTNSYFKPRAFKTRRREMFFAVAPEGWAKRAGQRKQDETSRIGDTPVNGKKKKNG